MTSFEFAYLSLGPFLPPLYRIVRKRVRGVLASCHDRPPDVLDVGGRKSPYTIGVPALVTITDLPRETEIQRKLNLGVNERIIEQTLKRRSNVRRVLLDDMTQSKLPDASFECVLAVEVLEHVREDLLFIQHVHRVLKPGGVFIMTTPNADHPGRAIEPSDGDTKRFYTKEQLRLLVSSCFESVEIEYAIPVGLFHTLGLRPWSIRKPLQTMLSMTGNLVNGIKSSRNVKHQAVGTRTLIALATKVR